jgi:predicted Zn-dependent protease
MKQRLSFSSAKRRGARICGGAILAALGVVFWSCQSMADAAGSGARIAAALGIIDSEKADAIGVSSRAVSRAVEEITPEQEYYLGRAVGAAILNRYGIWQGDPELTNYLNEICAAIVINSPRPEIYNGYHVAMLDSMEINAFATPGGHIFITRGMAACADSEDALAAVIAHEIAHIQLQHSVKTIKNSRVTQAITTTGASAIRMVGNDRLKELVSVMEESVNEIVTTLMETGYSQRFEYDADTAALALMAAAGYEPSSLVSMLRQLERNLGSSSGGFAKTHPSPAQRIAWARETVLKFKVPDTQSYRADRYGRIAG